MVVDGRRGRGIGFGPTTSIPNCKLVNVSDRKYDDPIYFFTLQYLIGHCNYTNYLDTLVIVFRLTKSEYPLQSPYSIPS